MSDFDNASLLTCPECGAPMKLRKSRYGPFYGCINFFVDGCKGSHGAHPDGKPLGVPADHMTKAARIRAHEQFDRLWKNATSRRRRAKRIAAYAWLRTAMALTREQCHIGNFTIAQCEQVLALVASELAHRARRRAENERRCARHHRSDNAHGVR